jgi:cell division septum initiation protein DivIVA
MATFFFPKKLWGYKKNEVDNYIKDLIQEHEQEIGSYEAEREQIGETNKKLMRETEALEAELARYRQSEKAIVEALVNAQLQADAIEDEARKQAGEIEEKALAEVREKQYELNSLRRQYNEAREDFKHVLEKYTRFARDTDEAGGSGDEKGYNRP